MAVELSLLAGARRELSCSMCTSPTNTEIESITFPMRLHIGERLEQLSSNFRPVCSTAEADVQLGRKHLLATHTFDQEETFASFLNRPKLAVRAVRTFILRNKFRIGRFLSNKRDSQFCMTFIVSERLATIPTCKRALYFVSS